MVPPVGTSTVSRCSSGAGGVSPPVGAWIGEKVAPQVRGAVISARPAAAQSPVNAEKTKPASGRPRNWTVAPRGRAVEHAEPREPQLMPSSLTIVPFAGLVMVRSSPPVAGHKNRR